MASDNLGDLIQGRAIVRGEASPGSPGCTHEVVVDDQRRELEAIAQRYTSPYRDVIRAKIVLMAAEGLDNKEIAARLDTNRVIVSKWRKRFFAQGLAGLAELPRGGRPPVFPPEVVVWGRQVARVRGAAPRRRSAQPPLGPRHLRRGHRAKHRRRDLRLHNLALALPGWDQAVPHAISDRDQVNSGHIGG